MWLKYLKINVFCLVLSVVLLLGKDTAWGVPTVFWTTSMVKPNEVALLAGGNFGKNMVILIDRIPDTENIEPALSITNRSSDYAKRVMPHQLSGQSVKFILPADLPMGLFRGRLSDESGYSITVSFNRPEPWWIQGDGGNSASPGGHIRIMGLNLSFPGQKTVVLLENEKGESWHLAPSEASLWNLDVPLPQDLAEGGYLLRIHNGFGGVYGWSESLTVTVQKRLSWKTTMLNVSELGADPTGMKDSTPAIMKALASAEANGGGVVYFPRGRYMISDVLKIPRFTILRGESRELSCLFWRHGRDEDINSPPPVALIQGSNSFGVEDLSLYSQYYQHAIVGDLGDKPGSGNIFLRRLRVRVNLYMGRLKPEEVDRRFRESLNWSTGGGDTVRLGGKNIEITDSDFYGSGRGLFLSRVRDGYVARNIFYNGRWGWNSISGSDRLIFEKNRIIGADLMSTGGGLNCLDGSSYSQNIYFAFNAFELMHGWDREVMTSDAGGGSYNGKIAAVDGKTLILAGDPQWDGSDRKGMGVFILDGSGKGQYRTLSFYNGKQIEVDRPWDIQPDENSHISITALQQNYMIIGNEFRDATVAVQFYGTSVNHVVAENRSWRAGGFHNTGMNYAGGWQPTWYVQFLGNEILEGNQGFNGPWNEIPPGDSHVGTYGHSYTPTGVAMNHCTVIRGNKLHNNARIEISGACEDVVVDGNLVENSDTGISIGSYEGDTPTGLLLYRNQFIKVTTPLIDRTQKALSLPAN